MNPTTRLLFTNEDLGHYFDDGTQGMVLISKVAKREWRQGKDFATGTIGGNCNERTDSSDIPTLYQSWRYVYMLDSRTYNTIHDILTAFLNVTK